MGRYEHWGNKNTYTILTTEANALMAEIHNIKKRMPVILKREDESQWLQGESIAQFAFPYSVGLVANPK
jgi:putative SOS response-associated peptidase YedK